jgi:hypothetical protein
MLESVAERYAIDQKGVAKCTADENPGLKFGGVHVGSEGRRAGLAGTAFQRQSRASTDGVRPAWARCDGVEVPCGSADIDSSWIDDNH